MCERQNTIYVLLISGAYAFRLMRFTNGFMLKYVVMIRMVQIDGPKRHVYIKFRDDGRMQDMLHSTGGQAEYRHTNGENQQPG